MPRKKQKPPKSQTNKELLILWARVLQSQQLWIVQIIQSIGAPLLPGLIGSTVEPIRRQLSVAHFNAWLDEGAPAELIEGLLAASIEERRIRTEIGNRLVGEVVHRLIDLAGGEMSESVQTIRSIFMVDQVKARGRTKFSRAEENEDARSDAFKDAWKNLSDQTEKILREKWPIPFPQTEFEAVFFERWQTDVLPRLNAIGPGVLACLSDPEAVNYIPARRAKDQIDRIRHATAQKRESGDAHLEYNETLDDELVRLSGSGNSAEDKAIEVDQYRELLAKISAVAGKFGPETRRAITLILRGESQKDAAKKEGIKPSTLNERIIKIRTEMKRTHPQ